MSKHWLLRIVCDHIKYSYDYLTLNQLMKQHSLRLVTADIMKWIDDNGKEKRIIYFEFGSQTEAIQAKNIIDTKYPKKYNMGINSTNQWLESGFICDGEEHAL